MATILKFYQNGPKEGRRRGEDGSSVAEKLYSILGKNSQSN